MRRRMSPMLCCVPDDASVRARIEAVVGASLEVLPGSIVCITCGLPEVVLGHPVLAITQRFPEGASNA